ncbi:hypothetical protein ACQKPX_11140 [Photobacterium sp. DNB23_23_1]|uniref:Uncharacterized protein n=1 Tax=Photobacterium pectinilyticum TaxID=2906793 RepID=A0ABT1N6G7_9GAMM|nr:hypothetical protein [Photobacterium sp. ZSDE20]MCQ1059697.1 hypothetical protein [Photobacterium sp. ZSDE20]MDD1825863.1 hypothetical protein [Photobacterium sp. ZSDE20]
MPFNYIIIGFALVALALDKLSIFDDDTADYVNVPTYQVSSHFDNTPEETLENESKVSYPVEPVLPQNSIDGYDAMMAPHATPNTSLNMKQVVLGGMAVPMGN